MKQPLKLLNSFMLLLTLFFSPQLFSQTSPISVTQIPFSDPDLYYTPGRAAEQWHNDNVVNIPVDGVDSPRSDIYRRFQWTQFETTVQGTYDWTKFDDAMEEAIDARRKLSFGIMTFFPFEPEIGAEQYDDGYGSYPSYLHDLMQGETNPDWQTDGTGPCTSGCSGLGWVPNWNSEYYLNRWGALNRALAQHIASTSYDGVPYANAIQYVDIRGYGTYGEWTQVGIVSSTANYPTGTRITVASQKRIIDSVKVAFANYPLVFLIAALDCNLLANVDNDPEIAHYCLTQSNTWGKFGWRRDSYGDEDWFYDDYLEANPNSYSGVDFDTAISNRYKYAPIVGEPYNGLQMTALPGQVRTYHTNSFGNGNYGGITLSAASEDSIRLASKLAGYRVVLDSGKVTTNLVPGSGFSITLYWKNKGLTPVYENWQPVFELRNGSGTVVWSGNSGFQLKRWWLDNPALNAESVDNFTLPGNVSNGNYSLYLIIKDPLGYRRPFPLAITGRNSDGSYLLKNITICVPTAVIAATSTCDGQSFNLTLSSATGASPYDLTINGVTYNNKTVSSTITTYNPTSQKIWNSDPSPTGWEDLPQELGVKFKSSVSGYIRGVRFYAPEFPDDTYTGHLWTSGGTLLASADFTGVTSAGWQEVLFSAPVPIAANTTYVASYHTEGKFVFTSYGLSSAVTTGALTALSSSGGSGNGVYSYGSSATFPSSTYQDENYWADVLFVPDTYTFNLTSVVDDNGCTNTGALQTLNVDSDPCEGGRSIVQQPLKVVTNAIPERGYSLRQSYPNPMHDRSSIVYTIPQRAKVFLALYDMQGRVIRILATGIKERGRYTVDLQAGILAKGIYYYRMTSENFSETRKLIIQ
jgi:hypothetical protein